MKNSEGIILASPSYNYNVTYQMKIFIDRMFCLYNFKSGTWTSSLKEKTKGIIIGCCAGETEDSMGYTITGMKRVLEDHNVKIIAQEAYYNTKKMPVSLNKPNIIFEIDKW